MYFCCCSVLLYCCCCCSYSAGAVRHRVPDGTFCCCASLHLIPVFSFSFFKHDIFLMHALAVLSQLQPRFTYNTYHTSSVVTGIRGAQEGVSPPGRSLYICRGSLMRGKSCRSTAGCDKKTKLHLHASSTVNSELIVLVRSVWHET